MRVVYMLQSIRQPDERYIGCTSALRRRLAEHDAGSSPSTRRHRPWRLMVVVALRDERRAYAFEAYLKSGSGKAFAQRHFW